MTDFLTPICFKYNTDGNLKTSSAHFDKIKTELNSNEANLLNWNYSSENNENFTLTQKDKTEHKIKFSLDNNAIKCQIEFEEKNSSTIEIAEAGENSKGSSGIIAVYPDAIMFMIANNNQTQWQRGCLAGKIYQPFNSNDELLGITGYGILGKNPRIIAGSSADLWISSNTASNTMQIGINSTDWLESKVRILDLGSSGQVGNNTRFPPLVVRTDTGPVAIGFTKYIRKVDTSRIAFRGLIPANDSDQAWLYLAGDSSTATPYAILWNKTVLP
jgi:hypothetical protein